VQRTDVRGPGSHYSDLVTSLPADALSGLPALLRLDTRGHWSLVPAMLRREVAAAAHLLWRPSTNRSYTAAWRRYLSFLESLGASPADAASPILLVAFLVHARAPGDGHVRVGRTIASLRTALLAALEARGTPMSASAVALVHRLTHAAAVADVLDVRYTRVAAGHITGQAAAITRSHLVAFAAHLPFVSRKTRVAFAAAVVAHAAGLRVGEYAASLRWADVSSSYSSVRVAQPKSGVATWVLLPSATPSDPPALDARRWLRALAPTPARSSDFVFCADGAVLHAKDINAGLRELAALAHTHDGLQVSAHGLRRGATVDAMAAGLPTAFVQRAFRWAASTSMDPYNAPSHVAQEAVWAAARAPPELPLASTSPLIPLEQRSAHTAERKRRGALPM
jgi:Phage integrase family